MDQNEPLIVGFVLRQLQLQRTGSPLLDLRALKHATFTKALVLMAVAFLAMMGSMILLPLYLQTVRGLSPLYTGLLVMPGGLAMGLLGPTVGRIFDAYGGRVLVIPGSIGIVLTLTGLSQISMTTPYWLVLVLHMVLMVSLASAFTPVFTLGLGSLPQHLYSHGSSILGTLQQVSYVLLVAWGAVRVSGGEMTMGALIACTILSGRVNGPLVTQLPGFLIQWGYARSSLQSLDAMMALPLDQHERFRPAR